MKLFQTLRRQTRRLDSRGFAHYAVPLLVVVVVAIAGTYLLVASHADAKNGTGGTAAPSSKKAAKPKPQKGALWIYSEQGRYNSVQIHALNVQAGTHYCGGTFKAPSYDVVKTLPSSKKSGTIPPLKVTCAAITGDQAYYVYYGTNKQFPGHYVAVDVDPNYCTLVHPDASLITKVPLSQGQCVGATSQSDTPTPVDVTVTIQAQLSSNKKNITGFIQVIDPTESLTRVECTGQVTLQHILGTTVKGTRNFPLRYTDPKGSSVSYCAARISNLQNITAGDGYTLKAWTGGSPYFNPAQGTATITIPPSKATKANGNSTTSAPK